MTANPPGALRTIPTFIVFLDFDGVTHPVRSRMPYTVDDPGMGREFFAPENLLQVNRLLTELDAHAVIVSLWRLWASWEMFQDYFGARVIGQTPYLTGVARTAEIHRFLAERNWQSVPWVAVDDRPAYYTPETPLIACDSRHGLTRDDVDTFLAIRCAAKLIRHDKIVQS